VVCTDGQRRSAVEVRPVDHRAQREAFIVKREQVCQVSGLPDDERRANTVVTHSTRTELAAIAVIGLLMAGCTRARDLSQARDTLLSTDRQWAAVASAGKDVERIVAFWDDDAEVYPAGAPVVRGKAAIRTFVRQSLATPGFHIVWHPQKASLSADGTMGYTSGDNALTIPGARGGLTTITGRYVTVWRRNTRGEWKCVIDIWNAGT
jgi:ketosteroid isomerase-like protein